MLDKVKGLFSDLLKDKKKLLIVVFAIVLFIGLSYYVYTTYVAPKLNPEYVPNNELVEKEEESAEAEIYLFHTQWCPHCKKAMPIWEQVKEEYNGKQVNGTTLYFREVDCDEDEETADKFNVEGYPTIKLVKGGQVIEYDAKVQHETLVEFINTSM